MDTEVYSLSFIDSKLQFEIDSRCLPLMNEVFYFFSSHFTILQEKSRNVDINITVRPYEEFSRENYKTQMFKNIIIRKNLYDYFNLYGEKSHTADQNTEIIDSTHSRTALVLDKVKRSAQLFVSEKSSYQVIDFIRDLLIRLEERRGSLVLHASAVTNGKKNIAIVGKKGAGKSTFLLEFVARHGFKFLTGDKLILRIKDSIIYAYGWPDYPSIGYGTILKHPKLSENLIKLGYDIDPNTPEAKILFPAHILKSSLGYEYAKGPLPLDLILLPNVLEKELLSIERIEATDSIRVIEHIEPSIKYKYIDWHSLVEPVEMEELKPHILNLSHALERCIFMEIKGKEYLSNDNVAEILGSDDLVLN
ncbi:hypothetical protein [Paenibacillus sp. NPDC057967]|uniref:hypothetical protein n=1 Tax=Paenibacillus sp. NPDC057967 TaxID=3346293 RepID=UPI0036DD048F